MKNKLKKYLTEDAGPGNKIYVFDHGKAVGYSESAAPACLTCFYSLQQNVKAGHHFVDRMTCENPNVFEAIANELTALGFSDFKGENPMKYHGQFDMMVHPQGKCKFWKRGRS